MRLDRCLTTLVFYPLVRAGFGPRRYQLPILMYHSISDDPEKGVSPYYRTATRRERFAEHMALLQTEGYKAVTLSQGLARLFPAAILNSDLGVPGSNTRSSKVHQRYVVLTFDDGFRNFYLEAFPILQQYGFGATMFLPTAYIGDQRKQFKELECLTWGEVQELHRLGIEFGSHTVTHPRLIDLEWAEIEQELRDSKVTIERRLGATVRTFAYPYAFPQANPDFVRRLRVLFQVVGYEACVTTKVGRVSQKTESLELKRLPVNTGDDAALLRAKLAGGYDWIVLLQKYAKQLKLGRGNFPPKWLVFVP